MTLILLIKVNMFEKETLKITNKGSNQIIKHYNLNNFIYLNNMFQS